MSIKMTTPKQPWEVFVIAVNFERNMVDGESIQVLNSIVNIYEYDTETKIWNDVSNDMIVVDELYADETKLYQAIQGGVHGFRYKASFRAYISETKQLEEDLIFNVRD